MNNEKFDLTAVDSTFTVYKKGLMFDGVVVIKRNDGVIFNIGGKNDAFISKEDFDDFEQVKIGDRFKVVINNNKNDEGMIEVSKSAADNIILENQNASKLKLASRFSFVPTEADSNGLYSKMGDYKIFIPVSEISNMFVTDPRKYKGKQLEAMVTEIKKEEKSIIGSVKLLANQIKENAENLFWNSIFINKIVKGKIKKIMPYGAFVDVDGVDCFLHISNISHQRLASPEEKIKVGEEYTFKVIELDHDKKKIALSLKALEKSPKRKAIEELKEGEVYSGKVIKILTFGAIVELENGATGLLHISNVTEDKQKNIYEIVKLDQSVKVKVISANAANEKVSFALYYTE